MELLDLKIGEEVKEGSNNNNGF